MREAGAILSTEMGLFVMDKLLLAPFAFNDAETWVLVGIGLLFAFVAGLEVFIGMILTHVIPFFNHVLMNRVNFIEIHMKIACKA